MSTQALIKVACRAMFLAVIVVVIAGCTSKPGSEFSMRAGIRCVFRKGGGMYVLLSSDALAYIASDAVWTIPDELLVKSAQIDPAPHEATWGSRGDPGGAFDATGFKLDIRVIGTIARESAPGKKTISLQLPHLWEAAQLLYADPLCYLGNNEGYGHWYGPDALIGSIDVGE